MERLQKIISSYGYTSRRKAEELITKGKVRVNGIVAKLGDKANYTDTITIDGKVIEDNYSKSETENFENVILKDDEYFVMGDNREVSKDSRVIGPINVKNIKGKTNLVIFPFNKLGIVE